MTERPLFRCLTCALTWYLRANESVRLCPGCKGRSIQAVPAAVVLPPAVARPITPEWREPLALWVGLGLVAVTLVLLGVASIAIIVRERGRALELAQELEVDAPEAEANRPAPPPQRVPASTPAIPRKPAEPEGVLRPEPKPTPEPLAPAPVPVTPASPAKPVAPMTPAPEPAAPTPPAPPPIAIAPPPRLSLPLRPPQGGWSSEWQKAGDVRIRVQAVSITRARLVDKTGKRSFSPDPCLVLWINIQNQSPTKPVEYRRWQPGTEGECVLQYTSRNRVGIPFVPEGKRLDWPGEFKQVLPPGGTQITEILVFNPPADGADQLTLILKGERINDAGDFRFIIPESAWLK